MNYLADAPTDSNTIMLPVDFEPALRRLLSPRTGEATDGGRNWTLLQGSVAGVEGSRDRGDRRRPVEPPAPADRDRRLPRHGLSSRQRRSLHAGGRCLTMGLYESSTTVATAGTSLSISLRTRVDPTHPDRQRLLPRGRDEDRVRPEQCEQVLLLDVRVRRSSGIQAAGGFENIFADTVSASDLFSIRYELATAKLPGNKHAGIYVGAGYNEGDPDFGASRLYRTDDASEVGCHSHHGRLERRLGRICRPTIATEPGFGPSTSARPSARTTCSCHPRPASRTRSSSAARCSTASCRSTAGPTSRTAGP